MLQKGEKLTHLIDLRCVFAILRNIYGTVRWEKSLFGIVGIETAFPLLHEYLVKTNIISIEKLLDLLIYNPNKRFNIETKGFSIWNLEDSYLIDNKEFISKGKATPFNGYKVSARNLLTVNNDKVIYKFIK